MTAHQKQVPTGAAAEPWAGRSWKTRLCSPGVVALLLAVCTLAVFWPAARHDFVDYDDGDYVTGNAHVQSGLTWANVSWAFTTGHASNWHPLTWLSHMLDWQLFGNQPGPQHLVSVAFHAANAVLLFLVLRRMTGSRWRSAFVAALFALHPLRVESVAWISERKDVLSTFFLMLTLGAYARYAERLQTESRKENPDARGRTRQTAPPVTHHASRITSSRGFPYSLALVFFALGLMSKPMLVTVPFLLLLLDYWPLARLSGPPQHPQAPSSHRSTLPSLQVSAVPWLVLEKLPFLALSLLSSVVTFIVQRKGGAVSTALSLDERVANALVSYARYLWKMVWPEHLSVLYPHPGHWPAWQVIGSAALLIGVTAMVCACARRRPYLLVGWLWFVGMMVPVIGIVQVGIQSMADRYTYVPLAGVFVILVWGGNELVSFWRWPAWRAAVAGGLVLSALAVLTFRQVGFWRNSETLFRHAVEATTRNYLAYNNLGFYFSKLDKADEAMENYRKSLEINPNYEDALNNLGHALAGRKQYPEAIRYYQSALRVRPKHAEVHNNLGNALSELGEIEQAITNYRVALEQNPGHADAHNNLGIALAMQGKLDEAIPHFQQALRLKPNYASAHSNLGNAFAAQHRLAEAIREFQECLRLNPKDAQGHNNLGNVLTEQGRWDEAVRHYEEALRLNGNNPEAHCNLGLVLLRQGKRQEAAGHFMEALRLKPDYAAAQKLLAQISAGAPKP